MDVCCQLSTSIFHCCHHSVWGLFLFLATTPAHQSPCGIGVSLRLWIKRNGVAMTGSHEGNGRTYCAIEDVVNLACDFGSKSWITERGCKRNLTNEEKMRLRELDSPEVMHSVSSSDASTRTSTNTTDPCSPCIPCTCVQCPPTHRSIQPVWKRLCSPPQILTTPPNPRRVVHARACAKPATADPVPLRFCFDSVM